MPFIIRNLTASNIELEDIGTTLFGSSTIDLRIGEDHQVIAKSQQIRDLVNSSTIAILDASGSALSAPAGSQLLDRVNIPFGLNDPEFVTIRTDIDNNSSAIAATPSVSVLNDISDVTVPSPGDLQVLQFNASAGEWQSGNAGDGITLAFEWRFSTNTNTGVDPGNNRFRYNNASPILVTDIALDDLDRSGFDVGNVLGLLRSGDRLYVQQKDTASAAQLFEVTASATDSTGYWNVPVSAIQVGSLPGNNKDCGVVFIFAGGTPDQSLWETITADTGSQAAGAPTATLTTTGVGGVTTAMSGSTLTISGSGIGGDGNNLAGVHAGLSASQVLTISVYNTINWDLTHFENNASVLSHDPITNNSRLTISEAGDYLVFFSLTLDPPSATTEFTARCIRNGVASAIPGSERKMNEDQEANDLSNVFPITMASSGYIELQVLPNTTTAAVTETSNFGMMRARGTRGEKGDPGSPGAGANIIVQDEGVNASGTPTGTMNFTGDGVSVSTIDSSSVEIIIGTLERDQAVVQARRASSLSISTVFLSIPFDTTDEENDATILEHNNTNTERIDIKASGMYEIAYKVQIQPPTTNNHNDYVECKAQINASTDIPGSQSDSTVFFDTAISGSEHADTITATVVRTLAPGQFVNLQVSKTELGGTGTATAVRAGGAVLAITRLKGTKGDQGDSGPAGSNLVNVQQSGSNVTGTPHSTLNFTGGITTADVGGSTVTISGSSFFIGSALPNLSDVRDTTTASAVDGEVLTYNASAGLWENQAAGGAGTANDAVQARRSTAVTITTAFQDITLDQTDVETDAAVVEHNNTNTDNIDIKATGTYEISYAYDVSGSGLTNGDVWDIIGRVRLGDTAVIDGSQADQILWQDGSVDGTDYRWHVYHRFFVDITASAASFVTLQIDGDDNSGSGGTPLIRANSLLFKVKRII